MGIVYSVRYLLQLDTFRKIIWKELAKYASSIDIEMDFITQRDFQNKEQYIEQLRADGFYGDHLEI